MLLLATDIILAAQGGIIDDDENYRKASEFKSQNEFD